MEHLFEIIGNGIVKKIQRSTSNANLWTGDYNENVDLLKTCKRACDKWIKTCEHLTTLYWPNYANHKWTGPKYFPESLLSFSEHIKKVRIQKKKKNENNEFFNEMYVVCVLDHINTVRE